LWYDPDAKTVEITTTSVAAATPPTAGDIVTDNGTGAQIRVLSAERVADGGNWYLVIIGITLDALLFTPGNTISDAGLNNTMVPDPATILAGGVDYTISQYDVKCIFDAVTGIFVDSQQTWDDTKTNTNGIRGLWRYVYLDNRENKSDAGYDLERYTIFATRDESDFPDATPTATTPLAETHTYHFRNRATPNIRRLNLPVLDRDVYDTVDGGGDYAFSDVNVWGYRKARFWNYLTWNRGLERETYLIGVEGGHYNTPVSPSVPAAAGIDAVAPIPWNCGVAGTQPPANTFDETRNAGAVQNYTCINDRAIQRRALIWFPTWYEWHAGQTGYTSVPEVGLHNWWAPFIWYWDRDVGGTSDFYAEPSGRFIERYNDSLFMARIERTELINNGDTVNDTVRWTYEPSGIMWSFWGYATGMEIVPSGSSIPVYPFDIPFEPNERVWGCAAEGFRLNRHTTFKAGDGLPIVGLRTWNESLYAMKPNGFMQIRGSFSGNFEFRDLDMSQGPAGPFAWAKTDMGIFYVTKKGLYLFDGNPASQNICLSDGTQGGPDVSKIFEEDIDWNTSTNFLTGEVISVSMVWDKANSQLLISYPKRGEQGGGATDLPRGTPTRMLVYDTTAGRFTEWDLPLPIDDVTYSLENPCPGMMLSGRDPTDDDKILLSHPIGNFLGANDDGRLLYIGSEGHRDNVLLDSDGEADAVTGDRITYDATSADIPVGGLKEKGTFIRWRSVIYANNVSTITTGRVKRKVIYNYYDSNIEADLIFSTNEEGYYSNEMIQHQTLHTGDQSAVSLISFKYYHDDSTTVGATLTQLNTGATMVVSSTVIGTQQVWGQDQGTGTGWDTVGANTVSGGGLAPVAAPTAVATVVNPDNYNPDDMPIEFIMLNVDVMPTAGDAGGG
jgi:hypothetical protein